MAAVDITCPHCNRNQKVAEHRLQESVYCLVCQQLITDVYLYKVAPKQQELTIKLKGRIVSEFGTTKLDELKSKSDEYTSKFEPVDDEESDEVDKLEETTRLFDTGGYRALPERKKLSTAAKTYLIGGVVVAVLTACVTILGVTMLSDDAPATGEIDATGTDGAHVERYPSGAKKAEWRVVSAGGVELIEGAWREWHEDGSDKTIGNYVHGEKVGVWRAWHANGQPALEAKYESGKETGPWIEWHANGRKAVEGAYISGSKHGEWRTWFKDGGYATIEAYDNGLPVGDWVSWHENDFEKLRGTYANGLREGRWVSFHDTGTEEQVENWKGGLLDGDSVAYHRNQRKSFEGRWVHGRREGPWTWWYSNGNQQRSGEFKEGLEEDLWQEWYPSGVLKLKGEFDKGRRIGQWQEFDEDGSLVCRRNHEDGTEVSQHWYFRGVEVARHAENFPNGNVRAEWSTITGADGIERRHGHERTYYSNGALAESGVWADGERDGRWRTFDEAGNTLSEELWSKGKKIE
jgi:antitoxin component YwqK of YwqJK toxin-antitoxin module